MNIRFGLKEAREIQSYLIGEWMRFLLFAFKYIWVRLPVWMGWRDLSEKTYLFLPINGAGLGHLSRSLSVAKNLKERQPDAKIIFLTTSVGVHLVVRNGFICHHVPPFKLAGNELSHLRWNRLFYDFVLSTMRAYRVGTLVFDGSIPYLGLQRILRSCKGVRTFWIRRGLYKAPLNGSRLYKFKRLFSRVIVPGEFSLETGQSPVVAENEYLIAPVVGLNRQNIFSVEEACRRLRLDPLRPRAYVQLGAGNINDIYELQERVVRLLRAQGIQVAVGRSPISISPQPSASADCEIIDFPNSQYFGFFNFAVLAGGYNSVCEAIALGLPAIIIPNTDTDLDDQMLRARNAEAMGPYICMPVFDERVLVESIQYFSSPEVSRWQSPVASGADEAVDLLLSRV